MDYLVPPQKSEGWPEGENMRSTASASHSTPSSSTRLFSTGCLFRYVFLRWCNVSLASIGTFVYPIPAPSYPYSDETVRSDVHTYVCICVYMYMYIYLYIDAKHTAFRVSPISLSVFFFPLLVVDDELERGGAGDRWRPGRGGGS